MDADDLIKSALNSDDKKPSDDYYEEGGPQKEMPKENVQIQHGVVIPLPLTTLTTRKVISCKECHMVLFQEFVIYKVVGRYQSSDNEMEVPTEYKLNYRFTRMRADICDVGMMFDNNEKLWGVTLEFHTAGPNTWHFESPHDAKKFHDVLQNYLVTRNQRP